MTLEPVAGRGALRGAVVGPAVRISIVFLALTVAGVLVHVFRGIIAPLIVAILLLMLIDGVSRDLAKRFPGVPRLARGFAAGALIIAGFAALTLLLVFRAPPFAQQLGAVEPHMNVLLAQVSTLLGQQPITVREIFHTEEPSRMLGGAFRAARSAATFAGLVMLYLGFLLASRGAFAAKLDRLFATYDGRARAERVLGAIRNAVEQYVRLVTFKALVIGIITFAVLMAFGVRSALFLAILSFLAAFVPIIGAFAAAIFPSLLAYAQEGDLGRALMMLAILGVCVVVIDNLVMPMLQGDELNIDPLLVLISIGFWAVLLGPTGALLSTPLTVTAMAVAAEFTEARWLAILISKDGEPLKAR